MGTASRTSTGHFTSPIDRVLGRLDNVRKCGAGWMALCPAHEDRNPSLKIDVSDDGTVLLDCKAGCPFEHVVAALDLKPADLFPQNGRNKSGPSFRRKSFEHSNTTEYRARPEGGGASSCTLEQYAAAKQLPIDRLRSWGLSDRKYQGAPAVRISYRDQAGQETAVRFRVRLEKSPDGDDRFRWQKGAKLSLYGRWRLDHARERGYVCLVEGESDCQTLWYHGEPAVGLPGANTWREDRDAPELDGIPTIYVVIEPDDGGAAVRKKLTASAIRDRVKLLDLTPYKDASALYLDDPEHFPERWQAALDAAVPWTDEAEAERQAAAADAETAAHDLLTAPDLLDRIGQAIRAGGYAGDLTPALLAYVALLSRLLETPINLIFVAESSAGKSRAAEEALKLTPPEAVYIVKAGSSRVLIYNDETFTHRVVFFHEADAIPEEGPAASAIRSLASDNYMEYEVTERDEQTGRFTTRKIHKPGPTGLLTTATKVPRDQLNTRVLPVAIPDDAGQTRAILHAHAKRARATAAAAVDRAPFLALQTWLELAGERRVMVPFADVLADLVPARTLRMRRDFPQLLTCIQTIALLYQQQRETTADGAIIATINDYVMARGLLGAVFTTVAAEGLTKAIRETVEAINDEEEVSETELARRLGLSKSTVSWRVKQARRGGWIVNNETKKGQSAKLARGVPLPEDKPALPDPEAVRAAFECSNDSRTEDGTHFFSDDAAA